MAWDSGADCPAEDLADPNGTSLLITVRGELGVSHHYFSSGSKKTGSSIRGQRIHIDRHSGATRATPDIAKGKSRGAIVARLAWIIFRLFGAPSQMKFPLICESAGEPCNHQLSPKDPRISA
ncbi:predicted protein [Coccidioides posadasii str. Silveira]|uniref:Predicted protein n=1 Tax=Coccidioides posadasii (strain RMSCC 757 / Silveira) TaxID=443226 RepID=E9D7D4_COCPS|nr:predicted protein [Coccidioides posadasii str. Silveira]